MAKEITEVELTEINLSEAKSPFIAKLKFSWLEADVENKNHRTYPHKVAEDAVGNLESRIQAGAVPGQSDHPTDGSGKTKLSNVSHILTKVWMHGKTAWAEAGILDTQKGRDALKVIKSGVPIGASLRGFGEMDKNGHIKPGLQIKAVDLVIDPSFETAQINQSNILESHIPEPEEKKDKKVQKEEEKDRARVNLFREAKQAGFDGTPEDFKQIRESIDIENMRVASKQIKEKRTIGILFQEAKVAGYQGTLADYRSFLMNGTKK